MGAVLSLCAAPDLHMSVPGQRLTSFRVHLRSFRGATQDKGMQGPEHAWSQAWTQNREVVQESNGVHGALGDVWQSEQGSGLESGTTGRVLALQPAHRDLVPAPYIVPEPLRSQS